MPTYEYRCPQGHEFEKFQRMSEPPAAQCPACGQEASRLLSGGGGLLFKGEGFYITDYRSENYKKAALGDKPEGGSGKGGGDTGGGEKGGGEKGGGEKSGAAKESGGEKGRSEKSSARGPGSGSSARPEGGSGASGGKGGG
jgi:putative FmdB family regulatory protein